MNDLSYAPEQVRDGISLDELRLTENHCPDPLADAFVVQHPLGSPFQLSGWSTALSKSHYAVPHVIAITEMGQVVGLLRLHEVRSRLAGHVLVSSAFCVGGGPLALDEHAYERLISSAELYGRLLGVDRIEFRQHAVGSDRWVQKSGLYFGFRKALDPDIDVNMKAIRRKQRAMIRKAQKAGLKSVRDDNTNRFYGLMAENFRRHGTPVPSRTFVSELLQAYGDNAEVLIIENAEREPVCGVLSLFFGDEVLPYFAGSSDQARNVAGNDFMYWEVLRRAVEERQCTSFDFGRSKLDTGPYHFKRHWGFEPEPIIHSYFSPNGGTIPDLSAANPKFQHVIRAWQKLPLGLTKMIGPSLFRHFP